MQNERSKIDWIVVEDGRRLRVLVCTSRTLVKAQLGRVCYDR